MIAFEAMHQGLQIAVAIGHSQWTVAHNLSLGITFCDLLAPEQVEPHCQYALTLAREIGSSTWLTLATGIRTRAFILMDQLEQAYSCLVSIGADELPMDTVSRRYWWSCQAELAFARGDGEAALEIVDRIIASVEDMMPGSRNSFIWRLRAKALSAVERPEEAESTLLEAQDHAQRIGELSQLWRIQADLGQLYGDMKRDTEAEEAYSAARNLIEELAATIPDEALRDNFFQRATESVTGSVRA